MRLEGRYVDVVPLTSARYADLFATVCSPEDEALWTYLPGTGRPSSLSGLWMQMAAKVDSEVELPFAFVPREGEYAGKAAGIASYLRIDPANGSMEVGGILFSRALQRTRISTEAISLLIGHAFDALGYRRFEWKCDSLNEPSRRAAARFGFTYEGRFRNAVVYKGRNRDTDWFSITGEEWPQIRAAHQRWLDPVNFDTDGRQRSSLERRPGS